jgi:hypothetical protein
MDVFESHAVGMSIDDQTLVSGRNNLVVGEQQLERIMRLMTAEVG